MTAEMERKIRKKRGGKENERHFVEKERVFINIIFNFRRMDRTLHKIH